MKSTISISLLLASLVPSVLGKEQKSYPGGVIELSDDIVNSASYPAWVASQVNLPKDQLATSQLSSTEEESTSKVPTLLFTLFCNKPGFDSTGGCQSYGGKPGRCCMYSSLWPEPPDSGWSRK